MRKVPYHGYCFVCGDTSKIGLNATMFLMDDSSLEAEYEFGIDFQGPPGYVHGAASFSLLDEVMGICAWASGYSVVLKHMEIEYLKMVPLYRRIRAVGRIERIEDNRKVFVIGEILDESETYIKARGLYIVLESELLKNVSKAHISNPVPNKS